MRDRTTIVSLERTEPVRRNSHERDNAELHRNSQCQAGTRSSATEGAHARSRACPQLSQMIARDKGIGHHVRQQSIGALRIMGLTRR